jgi:hypothetical protein
MPGRHDRDRLLALELKPGALAGARFPNAHCRQGQQATRSDTARRLIQFLTLLEQYQ